MLSKEISRLQHPIVKQFVKLRDHRKARYAEKKVPIMGIKQVEEASSIETLFITPSYQTQLQAKQIYLVSQEILKKMTGQPSPEPVAAIVQLPPFVSLENKKRIIALDDVTDPGNVGTLIRTACGLDFEGAFLTKGCADPFNEKALRSSMGATFRLPLQMGSPEDLLALGKHFSPFVASMDGPSLQKYKRVNKPLLVMGNEAQGVSPLLKEKYPAISIPITSVESLNVAAAGAILMYHFAYEG